VRFLCEGPGKPVCVTPGQDLPFQLALFAATRAGVEDLVVIAGVVAIPGTVVEAVAEAMLVGVSGIPSRRGGVRVPGSSDHRFR